MHLFNMSVKTRDRCCWVQYYASCCFECGRLMQVTKLREIRLSSLLFSSFHLEPSLVVVPSQQSFVGLQDVLKSSSRHVLKTSSRHVFITKCLLGVSVSNKSKSVSEKSISHIYIYLTNQGESKMD